MIKGIRRVMVLSMVLLALVFTSCTTNMEQPTEEIEETEEIVEEKITPVQGGTLSLSIITPTHLSPILNQQEDAYHLTKLIFEPLLSLDENYKIQGALAESWDIQGNGEDVILSLQKNVYWHDEEPFTAKDVKFTLDALKHKKVASPYKEYIKNISGYKVLDEHSIQISFRNGYSGNLESLTFPILPAHRYKKIEDVMKANKWSPIGTGPYRLEKYQKGKEITLKVNEKYWKKVPYIESIVAKIKRTSNELVTSFESKDVDLLRAVEDDWNRFGEDTQLSIYPYTIQKYSFIGLNLNNELFKDQQIRKAIQLAINRPEMLEKIHFRQGQVTDIPISVTSWLYDNEQKPHSYHPAEARQLLEEKGWTDTDKNKIIDKKIKDEKKKDKKIDFTFELITNKENKERKQEAQMIQKYLKAIGIEVEIKYLPFEEVKEKMKSKEFEAILTGWNLSFVPDLSFAFYSKEIEKGMNFISYKNKEMDQILIESLRTYQEEERKDVYSNLQNKISEQLPYVNLYLKGSAFIVNNRIKGPISPTDYNLFNNIEEWYIEYK